MGAVLSATRDYIAFRIYETPVRVWNILGVVAAILVGISVANYIRSEGASVVSGPVSGPRKTELLDGGVWQKHNGLLWRVTVSIRSGSLKVTGAEGPHCPNCRTGMVARESGGLFGTRILSEEYWVCPSQRCRTRRKIIRDDEDQIDEVVKIVKGEIERGELSPGSERIKWG